MLQKQFTAPSVYLILACILLVNLLSAGFVSLSGDEAYYWMYGQNLDWGYFDHPPMLALWIKMGYTLLPNTLGVRLFPVLFSTLSIGILYHLTKVIYKELSPKQEAIHLPFFSLFACCLLYQVYCFIATPDNPLLFFGSLFLFLYYHHLKQATWKTAIALGIVAAGLLYSKYHGILVLFFVALSNPRLFLQPLTYLAALIALLLFFPHLYWQSSHDYPSLVYHLSERHNSSYQLSFTLNYLLHQVLLFLPFLLFFLFSRRYRSDVHTKPPSPTMTLFFRACHFMILGIWVFFLLMSFKGKTQSHWTLVLCLPLLLLAVRWLINAPSLLRPLYYTAAFFVGISLLMRIFLLVNVIPNRVLYNHFFRGEEWAKSIQQTAQGSPVIFVNSYDKAARYSFYTQEASHSLNNIYWRKNQYDFWDYDQLLQEKKVFVVSTYPIKNFTPIAMNDPQAHHGKHYSNLHIYPNVCIDFDYTLHPHHPPKRFNPITISHQYAPAITLDNSTYLEVYFYEKGKIVGSTTDVTIAEWEQSQSPTFQLESGKDIHLEITFPIPKSININHYPQAQVSIRSSDLGPIRHLCK